MLHTPLSIALWLFFCFCWFYSCIYDPETRLFIHRWPRESRLFNLVCLGFGAAVCLTMFAQMPIWFLANTTIYGLVVATTLSTRLKIKLDILHMLVFTIILDIILGSYYYLVYLLN